MNMDREVKVDPLRQHILEGVECLRLRKCRPDRESIAHHVLRKFGSTMNEIFAELENIVDEGGLIKVEYKGTTSYRSPQSFDTKNSPLLTKHSKILNSSKTTRFINSGINELLVKCPTYATAGIPFEELKQKLVEFDSVRFAGETMNILLEREMSCGGIHIAKSNYLSQPLRVFPKDIPMPSDMQSVIGLGVGNSVEVKEEKEKKPKKPRKGSEENSTSTPPAKKGRKPKIKIEPEEGQEEEDMDEQLGQEADAPTGSAAEPEEMKPPPKKTARLTNAGRKIVAERVAEAVRKSYESTTEFETTSAQMIKLAEAVVSKQTEPVIEVPKGPSLVLASSINNDHSDDNNDCKLNESIHPSSNGVPPANQEQPDIQETSNNTTPLEKKRRGRASLKQDTKATVISPKEIKSEELKTGSDKCETSSPTEQGLTRSKRDKRKKMVFDPSDLPNTYSRSTIKNTRLSEKLLIEKSKSPAPTNKRGRKRVLVANVEKLPTNVVAIKANLRQTPETCKSKISKDCSPTSKMDLSSKTDGFKDEMIDDVQENENTEISLSSKKSSPSTIKTTEIVPVQCSYCQNTNSTASANDDILTCSSCNSNVHRTCMDYSAELFNRIQDFIASRNMAWQCFACKTCGICQEKVMSTPPTSTPVKGSLKKTRELEVASSLHINLCENCDAGFHAKCTEEIGSSKGAWICINCTENLKEEPNIDSVPEKPVRNKRIPKKKTIEKKNIKIEPPQIQEDVISDDSEEFPNDLRQWTEETVEKYFIDKGLRDEATTMRHQNIDGYSLLLLQRDDIVNCMGLRLGRALKVYKFIHELQQNAPVQPHSTWGDQE